MVTFGKGTHFCGNRKRLRDFFRGFSIKVTKKCVTLHRNSE